MKKEERNPRLGTRLDERQLKMATPGAPPVVLAAQVTSHIKIETPDSLKQWEKDLHNFYGIGASFENMVGSASESCSGGCSDDCDII